MSDPTLPDPDSEGWHGTEHDPRRAMIESAQSVVDDLKNLYTPLRRGEGDGDSG